MSVLAPEDRHVDMVNHPPHYAGEGLEAIEVIEIYDLGYHLGNALKYLVRAGRKTACPVADLRKAEWYIDRWIHHGERVPRPNAYARGYAYPERVCKAFRLDGNVAAAVDGILQFALSADSRLFEGVPRLSVVRNAIRSEIDKHQAESSA